MTITQVECFNFFKKNKTIQFTDIMPNHTPFEKELPDKLYFKVGEVSDILNVPAYVLRFWETEFKRISPKRTSSGQRLYRKSDIELILKIKYLLYEKKFTIEGAKQQLKKDAAGKKKKVDKATLDEIRSELESIRNLIR